MINSLLNIYPFYSFLIECGILASALLSIPYFLYPKLVNLLYNLKKTNKYDSHSIESWPTVDIVFAAFNEEAVIKDKLKSILALDYPRELLKVRIGSDCSTDSTDSLLTEFMKSEYSIDFLRMKKRSGKSSIINQMVNRGDSEIIVGTDANIFFRPDALKELVTPLVLNSKIHLVGGNLVYRGIENNSSDGVSKNEESYINWENDLKQKEGELWGCAMGVEGGCYAIRREAFMTIPKGTLMEDFFHTMNVLKSRKKVVHSNRAICTEDVSNNSSMEFNRKIRISQGNWQNLIRFSSMIFSHTFPSGLIFLGHKVLRWLFPIFFILGILINIGLTIQDGDILISIWSFVQLIIISFLILYPTKILPKFLSRQMKSISYFSWMNIALFLGLMRYIRTRETGIWQPTTRNNK